MDGEGVVEKTLNTFIIIAHTVHGQGQAAFREEEQTDAQRLVKILLKHFQILRKP